jgi:hypothetical protein
MSTIPPSPITAPAAPSNHSPIHLSNHLNRAHAINWAQEISPPISAIYAAPVDSQHSQDSVTRPKLMNGVLM